MQTPRLPIYPQWLVGFGAILIFIEIGCFYSWSSPYLVRLSRADSPIQIKRHQGSWIAALLNIGRLLGAVLGATLAQILGSRRSVLLTFLPILLGWLAVFFASSVCWLYASRILFGVAVGMAFTSLPMYIGEVASPTYRGALVSVAFVGSPISSVVTSYLGKYFSLQEFSVCYAVPGVLGLLMFWTVFPDSPQHLLVQDKVDEAQDSLRWYRGHPNVAEEFKGVREYVNLGNEASVGDKFREFKSKYVRRAATLVLALYMFAQVSGLNTLCFYTEEILTRADFHIFEPYIVVMLANVCSVVFTIVSALLIDRCGRKLLIIFSSMGIAMANTVLGTHFLLLDQGYDARTLQVLPLFSTLFFQASFAVGYMTVPSAVLSELLPINIKNLMSCFVAIFSGIIGFALSISFHPLIHSIGDSYVFFGQGAMACLVTPFALTFLPETKGKTLNEIQQTLVGVR